MFIIDDIFFFLNPVWIAKKIREMALEELKDTPEKLQRKLFDLQMGLETGEISEKDYQKKEKKILERLEALKKE